MNLFKVCTLRLCWKNGVKVIITRRSKSPESESCVLSTSTSRLSFLSLLLCRVLPLSLLQLFSYTVYITVFSCTHLTPTSQIMLNKNTLLLALSPITPLCQHEQGGPRSCDPPDEVIMWKQTVLNPLLTPVTPACYTTPDNERYTEGHGSIGQHFLWLWLHWSWFTVILRYEARCKMSNPAAAAQTLSELFWLNAGQRWKSFCE